MIVLGLDTATNTAGIAVVDDTRVLAEARHDSSGRNADLLVTVDTVCQRAGIAPHQLDAVAIGAGPGSFTGLRIGMATAKGIAFAARRPLWAVSSLAALAHDAARELADVDHVDALVVAALDARRGEVFAGCYRRGALVDVERVLAPGELVAWASRLAATLGTASIRYAGDAIDAHADTFAALADDWLRAVATPSGRAVAELALAGPRTDVLTGGAPTYIRASEAEIMYPDGVPGALRKR